MVRRQSHLSNLPRYPAADNEVSVRMIPRLLALLACLLALNAQADLRLASDRALVIDRDTGRTLYAKDAEDPAPIASVTKLMTAMVLLDARPDMRGLVTITGDDVDRLKYSSSRLPVGTRMRREDLLQLSLMSSENRATHALARTSGKGIAGFVQAMNEKARALGMEDSHFADPTGLSPQNRASARDLRKLLEAASRYETIREFTTETSERVRVAGGKRLQYRNSNPVVGRKGWDVLVSKTGFIREAGRVVVVGFKAAGRNLAVVLMGADSTAQRTRDLVKVRDWVRGLRTPKAKARTAPVRAKAGSRRAPRRR